MAVYYKFKSAKDYDSVLIEGQFISVVNLKERIFESKLFGKGTDFDLMISNAQTNEEYEDEGAMIPKNTSVLIRRVPGRPRKPIITERDEQRFLEDKVEGLPPSSSMLVDDSSTITYVSLTTSECHCTCGSMRPQEYEWDEFGNDLYVIPEVNAPQTSNPVIDVSPANKVDEDSKIKALIDTPALDWNRRTQEGRAFGRGTAGRMFGGRSDGRSILERKTPPAGYVCHRCKVPGHFIQHCPTNGDPNYDMKRVKPPTGIPKSMLMTTPDGSYALPSGAVAVLRPNEAAFEKEIEGLPTTRPVSDLPPELRCPLCKEVMKDAVLTSKCCFRSFCDKCIRDYIITKLMCVCGATNILADDLLPNKTLRETISRILESTTSSTENAGSMVQLQDMESSHPLQPKDPSPTLSAVSKDEPNQFTAKQFSCVKEGEGASETKAGNSEMNSSDKKVVINTDVCVATAESLSKEPKSHQSPPMPGDIREKKLAGEQGKKKKKKKARLVAHDADMQWRAYQDLGSENYGMPLAVSGYNPYWTGGMPLGVGNYMAPYGGPMPYMGYTPGPYDVPFGGGNFPQDPFAAQSYMMPVLPRDLSELRMGSMGMNQEPSGMSREEFEARKADLRHKHEMERLNERERGHSKDGKARRESSNTNGASMRPQPRLMSQAQWSDRSWSEKSGSVDCGGPFRDPARLMPPRPAKTAASDRYAAPGEAGSKKRKPSSPERSNGLKELKGGERRGISGYDHESNEVEYHLKRRPSSSSAREATSRRHREWEPRGRGGREQEHGHERPASKRR
uniref:DWNN domain-containing protein n=1 Tax=Musa acuminata subsp. malaccensis TaxID=214687 RepID=A0A804INA9_MUSAM|nr:PREDICTED: uncharacterized protein LOC103981128 isoform X1 [Musa acuminata subsp. malaccensis]